MERPPRRPVTIGWRGLPTGIGLVVAAAAALSLVGVAMAAVLALLFR